MQLAREKVVTACVVPFLLFAALEFVAVTLDLAPEVASPLVVWNPRRDAELTKGEGEFRAHRAWLWEPRPGARVHGGTINEDAMRGPRVPAGRAGGLRIAVLGDSTTYGFGHREQDAWGRVLETVLRGFDADVEVLNFGVIGFSIEQGYRMYVGKVRRYRPDVVIAAFGAVNDHFPNLATDRAKIDSLSHPAYRARRFLDRYGLFRLLERAIEGPPRLRVVDDENATPRVPVDDFVRRIVDLKRAVEQDGARLVLVSPPRRLDGEVHEARLQAYTDAIHEVAAREGIPLAPVRDVFRAADRAALGERWEEPAVAKESTLFLDAWHPTVRGHLWYAATVGKTLVEAGFLPELAGRPEVMELLRSGGE